MTIRKDVIDKIERLSSRGLSSKKIAEQLHIDAKTVGKYARGKTVRHSTVEDPKVKKYTCRINDAERGEISARLFARFNRGEKPEDVVVDEKMDPRLVHDHYEEWLSIKEISSRQIVSEEANKINRNMEALRWRIDKLEKSNTITPLLQRLQHVQCPRCKKIGAIGLPAACAACGEFFPLDHIMKRG